MTLLEAIEEYRRALLSREAEVESGLIQVYQATSVVITNRLNALIEQAEKAVRAGQIITEGWFAQAGRLGGLLQLVESQILSFSSYAERAASDAVYNSALQALDASHGLMAAARGPVPAGRTVPAFANAFNPSNVEQIQARLSDGAPLQRLIAPLKDEAVESVRQIFVPQVVQGRPLAETARLVSTELEIPLRRARTITRTEVLGAYRDSTRQSFEDNDRFVQGWTWRSARSLRTCVVCIALDGRVFPTSERQGSHPNCRCTMVPVMRPWSELGIDFPDRRPRLGNGEDWFANLSEEDQAKVLGREKLGRYRTGTLRLTDLVAYRVDAEWGPTRWERSLGDLRAGRYDPGSEALGVPLSEVLSSRE
jgi:SPP1 gp7 family putative phage head morphogenesis protein